jgi:hypothetical protein
MALSQKLEVKIVEASLSYWDTAETRVPVRVIAEEYQFGTHRYYVQPFSSKEPRLQGEPRWVDADRIREE